MSEITAMRVNPTIDVFSFIVQILILEWANSL